MRCLRAVLTLLSVLTVAGMGAVLGMAWLSPTPAAATPKISWHVRHCGAGYACQDWDTNHISFAPGSVEFSVNGKRIVLYGDIAVTQK